jgi:hypothetical protein
MKYLKDAQPAISAAQADSRASNAATQLQLLELTQQLAALPAQTPPLQRADLLLQIAHAALTLEQKTEAWRFAEQAFALCLSQEAWEEAVQACDILFGADQPGSLPALGQGIWLAVTFPIDPELTAVMLEHLVEETPDDADGGAVAAATACYVIDLRATEQQRDNLMFFANQLLGKVARRHGQVQTQAEFTAWISRLGLDHPEHFLGRLSLVIEVLVQDDWWFDRDELRAKLPTA